MLHGRPPRIAGFPYLGIYRYSLCFVVYRRARAFADASLVTLAHGQLVRTCMQDHFALLAYCFMPDHLHLVLEGTREDADLRHFVKVAKQRISFAARTSLGTPLIWQDGFHDHVLRSDEATDTVVRYVLDNPVRAGLVERAEDYAFSGAK